MGPENTSTVVDIPIPEQATGPVMLRDTRDVEVSIEGVCVDGCRITAPGRHRMQGRMRVLFHHRGQSPGRLLLLAEVQSYLISYPPDGVETELLVRYLAVYTRAGRGTLREFLYHDLCLDEIDNEAITKRRTGWFYKFLDDNLYEQELTESQIVDLGPAPFERRQEERVSVRVAMEWTPQDDNAARYRGTAYNISRRGLYVMSQDPLPALEDRITVHFPLTTDDDPPTAHLTGEVCWTQESMGGSGGGYCLQISKIEDGADGESWHQYVEGEGNLEGTA